MTQRALLVMIFTAAFLFFGVQTSSAQGSVTSWSFPKASLGQLFVWSAWIEKADPTLYPSTGNCFGSFRVRFVESEDHKLITMRLLNPETGVETSALNFPVIAQTKDAEVMDLTSSMTNVGTFLDPSAFKAKSYSVNDFKTRTDSISFSLDLILDDARNSEMALQFEFRRVDLNRQFQALKVPQPLQRGLMPAYYLPQLNDPMVPIAIRRISISKPFVWKISPDVPASMRAAIKEGIMWWNSALRRSVFKVEDMKLSEKWTDPRLNTIHWIGSPNSCGEGAASAYAVTSVDPETGEVLAGKITMCGFKFLDAYIHNEIPDGDAKLTKYRYLMMREQAAHESGHILGLVHNFKGKIYRDRRHPEILTDSVMDYPLASDVVKMNAVGPRDIALMNYLYINRGSEAAWNDVQKYPSCVGDLEEGTIPDCHANIPGGMHASELVRWYADQLALGTGYLSKDLSVSIAGVAAKLLFTHDDSSITSLINRIAEYNGLRAYSLANYAAQDQALFQRLPSTYKATVRTFLETWSASSKLDSSAKNQLRSVIRILFQ